MSVFRGFAAVFICIFLSSLLFFSSNVAPTVSKSLSLCATSVIPSLFPFLVVTKLFLNLKLADALPNFLKKAMKPLFSVSENSFSALILGLISGYPVGATVCAELYKDKLISKKDAERTLAFCNNAGPAFILSTVGAGMFSSLKIGVILLLIHICSAIITGALFRFFSPIDSENLRKRQDTPSVSFSFAFTDAIYGATISSLIISAYIVFFSVFTSVLNHAFPALSKVPVLRAFLFGVLEITSGSYEILQSTDPKTSFILISALLGWGGLCVHFQALSFIRSTDLKTSQYFAGKLTQSLVSALFAFFVSNFSFFEDVAVFADGMAHYSKGFNILFTSTFLLFFCLFFKKGWKKTSA